MLYARMYIVNLTSANPVNVKGTNIYFRGFKILQLILQSVMDKGMSNAKEVILTGCSGTYNIITITTFLNLIFFKINFSWWTCNLYSHKLRQVTSISCS